MSCSQAFPQSARPKALTTFILTRDFDESKVSGTGVVLEGVVFHDGSVAVHWVTPYWSVTFYPDLDTFLHLHIFSHPTNKSTLVFWCGAEQWSWVQE